MSNLELQVAALARLVTAEDEDSRKAAKAEVLSLMKDTSDPRRGVLDLEVEIRTALLKLGVPEHIKGHAYLVRALCLAVEEPEIVNNLTKRGGIYHRVAEMVSSTPSRVERAIRHGIECAWERGDLEVFDQYFGNTISPSKGKPTNSEFIARMANEIRMRMKEVA